MDKDFKNKLVTFFDEMSKKHDIDTEYIDIACYENSIKVWSTKENRITVLEEIPL